MFRRFNLFFAGNVHKKGNNCKKCSCNLESGNVVSQVNHNSSNFSSAKTPSFQNSIAPNIFNVNTLNSLIAGDATRNTTTKFPQILEKIFNCAEVIVNMNATLANLNLLVNSVLSSLRAKPRLPDGQGSNLAIHDPYSNLEHLLNDVKKSAKLGDTILFSPAATSFNMFQNEFDRGRKFNEAVERIFK